MRTVDILLGGMVMSSVVVSCQKEPEVPDTYNVLFLAVDDMRDWVGYLGGDGLYAWDRPIGPGNV